MELSLYEFMEMFPDEQAAADFFERCRWKDGPVCPHCESSRITRCAKPMPFRCKDCRRHFSVRTGTVMAESRLPLRKWLMAYYFMRVSRKGVSSHQLAKMIGVQSGLRGSCFIVSGPLWLALRDFFPARSR